MDAIDKLMLPPVRAATSKLRQIVTVLASLHALTFRSVDLVEAGVFHGGTTILMARAVRFAHSSAKVYACDSFRGLPRAQVEDGANASCTAAERKREVEGARRSCLRGRLGWFASPSSTVEHALRREKLRSRVVIVQGWFHKTLPPKPLTRIGFLRVDGDTFNGTYEALVRLHPLVVRGGIVYVDDYGSFRGAKRAVDRFLEEHTEIKKMHRILENDTLLREPFFEAVVWCKGGCASAFLTALTGLPSQADGVVHATRRASSNLSLRKSTATNGFVSRTPPR